ncbi:hypothetical protein M427DRAFT_391974 [Gonapodya prolifera JEL478]|uniref:C2 domain-containing protein n=1 Tax=Gonapodya prolifera (strain JEL478) TaxID=1344416 RepID=A0A139A7J5_GONPJ|nr:hypothetical protein M427DRAFT_391974 [Gonapodya prolifera JEL478]|eukprot:KXS12777.1 hypothetical protein M427DRAFT_391974 [Gonapodya prolifera JEL478]
METRRAKEYTRREVTRAIFALKAESKEDETLEWFNAFLEKYWLEFQPWLAETIKTTVNDTLVDYYLPSFLDSFQLTEFDLGSAAPSIVGARFNPLITESDVVELIFRIQFSPLTQDDLNAERQRKGFDARNARVITTSRVKGMKGVPFPVQVDNLEMEGEFAVRLRLGPSFPNVKTINICCPDGKMPRTEYSVRPLKGGDILDVPGLNDFIRKLVDSVMKMMFSPPNGFFYNVESLFAPEVDFQDEFAVGVLRVTIRNARGLRNAENPLLAKFTKDKSDPYCRGMLGPRGQRKQILCTKTVEQSQSPRWSEVFYHLVKREVLTGIEDGSDILSFELRDRDDVGNHPYLGDTDELHLAEWVQLRDFKASSAQKDITDERKEILMKDWGSPALTDDRWLPLFHHNDPSKRDSGELKLDLAFFPIIEVEEAQKAATVLPGPDATKVKPAPVKLIKNDMTVKTGVVRVKIFQCKDIGPIGAGWFEPYIVGRTPRGQNIWKSKKKKRTNNPVYYETFELFADNIDEAQITLEVRSPDNVPGGSDKTFGDLTIPLKDAIEKQTKGTAEDDWFSFASGEGAIRLSFRYLSVEMPPVTEEDTGLTASHRVKLDTASGDSRDAVDPYGEGIVEVTIVGARQLPAADANGLSDPYVQCQLNGEKVHNTRVVEKELNPVWNEKFQVNAQIDLAEFYDSPGEAIEKEYVLSEGDTGFRGGFVTARVKFDPKRTRPKQVPQPIAGVATISAPAPTTDTSTKAAPIANAPVDIVGQAGQAALAADAAQPVSSTASRATLAPVPGKLRVELISGKKLPAVNKDGLSSDPYVELMLEDREVGKSQTIEKNVNPVWNEIFVVSIPDIKRSSLSLKVKDKGFLKGRLLGITRLPLENLDREPHKELRLELQNGDRVDGGEIHVKLSFSPAQ